MCSRKHQAVRVSRHLRLLREPGCMKTSRLWHFALTTDLWRHSTQGKKKKGRKQPSFIIYSLKTHVNMSTPHPLPAVHSMDRVSAGESPSALRRQSSTVQTPSTSGGASISHPHLTLPPSPPFHPTSPSGTPPCLKDDTVDPGWVPREKQIVVLFFCSNRTEQQVACLS